MYARGDKFSSDHQFWAFLISFVTQNVSFLIMYEYNPNAKCVDICFGTKEIALGWAVYYLLNVFDINKFHCKNGFIKRAMSIERAQLTFFEQALFDDVFSFRTLKSF